MTYDDYPGCLERYKWLLELAEQNLAVLFNDAWRWAPPTCKACGEDVARSDWKAHLRNHLRYVRQSAKRREREAARERARRLRMMNRRRAENRALEMSRV